MLLCALLLAAQPRVSPHQKYDPARDADKDLRNAIAQAQKTDKRILLEVGGEWCTWCHILDRYFRAHPDLTAARDRHYVTVKINVSAENQNKTVLSRYPGIPGYPHFFVLDSDGTLLRSQKTSDLEDGASYSLARFTAFLEKWAPARR